MARSGRSSRISPVASPVQTTGGTCLVRSWRPSKCHFEGEDLEIPAPSSLDELRDNPDYEGGQWVFVDIEPGALDTRKERINLSVPAYALREIDVYVQAHGGNRSGFMVTAALSVARGE